MSLSRRDFLKALSMTASAGVMTRFGMGSLAQAAAAQTSRRFIFLYFGGGWDQMLFLDPRDPATFTGTKTQLGYGQLNGYHDFGPNLIKKGNLTFGPATEKPAQTETRLSDFYDKIAVVRGINMGTLGHDVGYHYFLTARFPSGNNAVGTSIATELIGQINDLSPCNLAIPNVALGVESYNQTHSGAVNAVVASSIDDLFEVLARDPSMVFRDDAEAALVKFRERDPNCLVNLYDKRQLFTSMRATNTKVKQVLDTNLASKFAFVDGNDAASAAIRQNYYFGLGDAHASGAHTAFAAQAIKTGMSQCVSVDMGVGLDTHGANNQGHADQLHAGITALASLLKDLSTSTPDAKFQLNGSWLDNTTILCFSEFARTPMFNPNGGRDHHLCSSCLIAGAGIKGNQVVGASGDDGYDVGLYDFAARTEVPSGGENIKPEHIASTLLASAGLSYDIPGLRTPPLWKILQNG